MKTDTELEILLEKYLNNTLKPEEKQRLVYLVQNDENKEVLRNLISKISGQDRSVSITDTVKDKQLLFDYITDTADKRKSKVKIAPFKQTPLSGSLIPYAAACIIVVTLCFVFFSRKEKETVPVHAENKIHPGENKAVLILSGGKRIELNNVGNGDLAEQQDVKISKPDNGSITYTAGSYNKNSPDKIIYNELSVPAGGQFHIILPDGTKAWLNSASSLRFPVSFTGINRQVELTGEAYFEVKKDASKPFIVSVNEMRVTVLGTQFNMMAYKDETSLQTTLVSGSVKLSYKNASVIIKPREQAALLPNSNYFEVTEADLDKALAWKNGEFHFNNTPIETIMRQISRWYNVSVVYEGNKSSVRLSGIISRKKEVLQLLEILEATHKVKFRINGNQIMVL